MFYLLAALFALAPTFAVRFNLLGIPLNLLELLVPAFLLVFAFWLKKSKLIHDFKSYVGGQPRLMLVLAGIFLLAGLISAAISPSKQRGAGLFLVYFLEPILLYLPASYILSSPLNKLRMVKWIFVVIAAYSAYAILQYFTGLGLPLAWQGNPVEPRRALSFFNHPNAFALLITPLLAFLMPFFFERKLPFGYKICYLIGVFGLLLSLSRGGWLGFAAAGLFYIVFFAKQKIKLAGIAAAAAIIVIVLAIPFLKTRVRSAITGDRSTESRISLWQTGRKMIASSPLLGKGLYGFEANFNRYNSDPMQKPINLAHNIFLDFWVETGLLGLISICLIILFAFYRSWRLGGLVAQGIALFLIALLVHGQVDNPYMQNDLALVFWMVLALQS